MISLFKFEKPEKARTCSFLSGELWMAKHIRFNDILDCKLEFSDRNIFLWEDEEILKQAVNLLYSNMDKDNSYWIFNDKIIDSIVSWSSPNCTQLGNLPGFFSLLKKRIANLGINCFDQSVF